MKRLIFAIFLILLSLKAFPQKKDTVWVKGKSILILGDTSIFIAKDTVFVLPDSIAVFLKEDTIERPNRFYKKIKKTLYKTTITTELYHLLFDDPDDKSAKQKPKTVPPRQDHSDFIGKIITDVNIEKLAVFGTDINDTTKFNQKSWLLRRGNKFHNYTRNNIIRNHLFFSEGELFDPVKIEDSERTLRNLPYIQDARILVDPIDEETVRVVVIVKDNWSLYPGGQIFNFNKFWFSLNEKNFMGWGHQFSNELRYDQSDNPKVGYIGNYRIKDIKNTFITVDFDFAESDDYQRRGIRISRDFVTPDIELAGGIEASLIGYEVRQILSDTLYTFDTRYQYQDVWLSHAYPVGAIGKRKRLITGTRFVKYDHLDQPEVAPDSNYQFFDRDQYLFNIGISRREYERSTLIYGYGRTEDIPIGYLFGFTAGREYSQFYDRWYGGINYAIGDYVGRIGYFRPMISIGSFLRDGNLEQGLVRVELSYFSYLYQIKKFAFRQFFYINYTEGFRRFGNEFISINDREGIRGLSSIQFRGTKKLVLRSETLSFTPFYILGFRMAIFAFADLAAIQTDEGKILDSKFYQGYGLGFRFRNENLAIKSFLIRVGFYPNAPDDLVPYDFDLSTRIAIRPNDFDINRPQVFTFD